MTAYKEPTVNRTTYNVHIYREMKLVFGGIDADSHEAAAAIARDKPTEQADSIDDCDGETLAALVDVAGDEEYAQSRTIDFEIERQRKAATKLLATLKAMREEIEQMSGWWTERLATLAQIADADIAKATAAGMIPTPGEIDVHALLADRRQIAHIWSIEDVQSERPDLDVDQSWQVLQKIERELDSRFGITWEVLNATARELFGDAPENNDAEEA
jgi:hypothetical protein